MTPRARGLTIAGALSIALALPFLVAQTGPVGGLPSRPRFAGITLHGSQPAFEIRDTAADTDEERWQLKAHSAGSFGCLAFNVENDAGTVVGGPMIEACRDGTTQETVSLGADAGEVNIAHDSVSGAAGAVSIDSYTGAVAGCTTDPAPVIRYTRIGGRADAPASQRGIVSLYIPAFTCTSNLTTFNITGGPALISPTGANGGHCEFRGQNNSVAEDGLYVRMSTAGTIVFLRTGLTTGWTNSGTKGVDLSIACTYQLDNG